MKVKFKANACGFGFGYVEGVHDVPRDVADKAVKEGAAEPVADVDESAKKEGKKAEAKK